MVEPKRIKKGWLEKSERRMAHEEWLTQEDIDRPIPPISRRHATWREALQWFTLKDLLVIAAWGICFATGAYLLYLAWGSVEYYKSLAGRG